MCLLSEWFSYVADQKRPDFSFCARRLTLLPQPFEMWVALSWRLVVEGKRVRNKWGKLIRTNISETQTPAEQKIHACLVISIMFRAEDKSMAARKSLKCFTKFHV